MEYNYNQQQVSGSYSVYKKKPILSLSYALTSVIKKYATFSGRARRSEYWWFWFACYALQIIFVTVQCSLILFYEYKTNGRPLEGGDMITLQVVSLIFVLIFISLIIPSMSVAIRRLHDTGRSGWNVLWCLVPFIGPIVLLVFTLLDSDPRPNKYGPSPKYYVQ